MACAHIWLQTRNATPTPQRCAVASLHTRPLPNLANSQGAAVFEEKLLNIYFATYKDQVNAVRVAATQSLQPLARTLGGDWVRSKLIPRLVTLYDANGSSYLQRITVLYGVQDLLAAPELVGHPLGADLLTLLLRALNDNVANVRFVAAQVLENSAGVAPAAMVSVEARPALSELAHSDPDADVRFFAGRAAQRLGVR